jgi:hypothetical protein
VDNTTFFFDTFTIPYINSQVGNITSLNVQSLFANSATIYGANTLNVLGISNLNSATLMNNLYASNSLQTTNIFATTANVGTLNVATISNLNSLVLMNNLYASNALSTTNVFATTANVGTLNVATISNLNTLVLTNNLYAANALSTTNVFVSNGLDVGPGTLGTNVVVFSNISGGSNVFVMNSNGQIGIGTTNPGAQLDIYSTASTSPGATVTNSGGSITINAGVNAIYFSTGGTVRGYYNAAGFSPNADLATNLGYASGPRWNYVNAGTVNLNGGGANVYAANAVTTTNLLATTANVGTLNVATISNLNSLVLLNNLYASNSLAATNVFATTANVGTLNVATISNLNSLVLTNNLYASNSLSTTNVFASNGLDVGPGTLGTNVVVFSNILGGANTFVMDSNGSIGIGTAAPQYALDINYAGGFTNKAAPYLRLGNITGGPNATAGILISPWSGRAGGATCQIIGVDDTSSSAHLTFWTAPSGASSTSVERVRILNNGFVGIGLTNPSATLQVAGNIYASNALQTTNLFATSANVGTLNVFQISNLSTLVLLNNIYVANSITTTNLVTAGITSNASNTVFNFDTLTIPFINSTTLNVASASNLVTAEMQGSLDSTTLRVTGNVVISNALTTQKLISNLVATGNVAPTIASATTIAPTSLVSFVSGTTAIATITAPWPVSTGGTIMLIPTGLWTTTTAGNIALASTAVVFRTVHMTWDSGTSKWYPSY